MVATVGDGNLLRREGDVWHVVSAPDGRSVRLRDAAGLRLLARLVECAGRELHVLDLSPDVTAAGGRAAAAGINGLDAAARSAYRRRIGQLQAEIDEADDFHDPARAEGLRAELDALTREIARTVGLGGRDRPTGSASERARVRVTRALRAALDRLGTELPRLGAHLDHAVHTGTYCRYEPDPVAPLRWRVDWSSSVGGSDGVELPALPPSLAVALGSDAPFVGRADQVSVLDRAAERARGGQRTWVALSGEPGAGKTRLAAETARRWRDSGGAVVFGRCNDEALRPFQPLAELVPPLLGLIDGQEVAEHVGAHGAVLGRISPESTPVLGDDPGGVPATERRLLVSALEDLLVRVTRSRPLMVVLDDLHWIDAPTVQLLRQLVAEPASRPLVFVALFRDTETPPEHPLNALLAELARGLGDRLVHLGGLPVEAVAELVRQAGVEADPARLARDTAGNPLYVGQVLRSLGEGSGAGAEALANTVGYRVAVLPEVVRELLAMAAVCGEAFSLGTVEAVGVLGSEELGDAADEARRAGLVAEVPGDPDGYRFIHAVVRDVVLAGIGASRRRRLHGRIAEALARVGGPSTLAEEAWHRCAAARAAEVPLALDVARRAGEQAIEQLGFEQALSITGRALELVGPRPVAAHQVAVGRLLLVRNEAEFRLGDVGRAGKALEQLFELEGALADAELMAEAVARLNRALSKGLPELVDRAAVALRGTPYQARAEAFRLQYRARNLQEPGLGDAAERAVAAARVAADRRALAAALVAQVVTRVTRPEPSDLEALEEAEQLLLGLRPLPIRDLGEVLLQRPLAQVRAGRPEAAGADHERLRRFADRHGLGQLQGNYTYHDSAWALARGDFANARRHLAEYARFPQVTGDLPHTTLAVAVAESGCYDDAAAQHEQEHFRSAQHRRELQAWRAEQLSETGASDQARALVDHFTRDGLAAAPRNFMLFQLLLPLARAVGNLGPSAATPAAAILPLLEPWRGWAYLRAAHIWEGACESGEGVLLLVLGRLDEAVERLRGGITLEDRLGARLLATRSRFWLGRALAAAGCAAEAGATWSEALEAARIMGAQGLVRRLELELS